MMKQLIKVVKNLFAVADGSNINVMKMQRQIGSQDCGLFAIAVSTLLNGLTGCFPYNILPKQNEISSDFLLY